MSDPAILTSLINHLAAKGMPDGEARQVAIGHLEKSGILRQGSLELTDRGQVRNAMGAKAREHSRNGLRPLLPHKQATAPAVQVHKTSRTRTKR